MYRLFPTIDQLSCFYESFLREFVEGREPTISIFSPLHARGLASMMPRLEQEKSALLRFF